MKNKTRFLLAGGLLLLNVLFIGGRLPYFLFYVYCGVLILPILHGYIGRHYLKGTISVPSKKLVAGEEIVITTRLSNEARYSFPRLELENSLSSLLSGQKTQTRTFHIEAGETYQTQTRVTCRRRGIYKVGETQVLIKDIFNLFEFKKKLSAPISLKVYPRILPLSDFQIEAGHSMGDLIVEDPVFQDYASIDTLRSYREGDPVKKIHWHASAKQDRLIVKDFELHGDAEVILLINQNQKDYQLDSHLLLQDKIVEISAAIVNFCLSNHLAIDYYIETKNDFTKISGDTDKYLNLFLDQLISFEPMDTKDFCKTIENLRPSITQGTTFILISPLINKNLATQLLDLKMHNIRPMIIWVNQHLTDSVLYKEQKALLNKLSVENILTEHMNL